MFWYKRHIGDYSKKAGRLSILEHGAYTLLLDACYDRERFPSEDDAIDWCWARSDEEIAAVRFVLRKFFTLVDGVYVQSRITEEIEKYKAQSETNARIAKEREARRKTIHARSVNEPPPNQEPRTENLEPITNNQEATEKDYSATNVAGVVYSAQFLTFWNLYPNKKNKGAAFKAFKKLKSSEYADIRAGLERAIKSADWKKENGRFIPHPATWLNARGWEDETGKPEGFDLNAFMRNVNSRG